MSLRGYADMFAQWVNNLEELWEFLITPNIGGSLRFIMHETGNPISDALLSAVESASNLFWNFFGDASLLEIILGTSITVFILYTLVKWVLDIVF